MKVMATDILNALFNPTDVVCFRVLDDKKTGVFQGLKLSCECGKYKSIEEELRKHNALNRGVFYVVNFGGHTDETITRINAQFVEMDQGSFEEQMKKIEAFPIPPSMIIRTRKSYHVYWFMDSTAVVERFRIIQSQLVKWFDGDPACVNASRVMRLPGFMHCKKEPVEVECVSFHPERKYSQDNLSEVLPEVDLSPAEHKTGAEKGMDQVIRSCLFLQHCRDDAASLSEHDWYAMITNLAPFTGGAKLIHEWSAPYPGYSENATQKKINHFLESGTNPITCKVICEKGFSCPKYEKGECPVKAPAAWCYQPIPASTLLEILHALPVSGEVIRDLQTAREFITDYLYNQDVVIADVIINTEVRDHFKLKNTFLKPLNTIYRNISREYQSGKNAKRAKAGTSLPDWYEPCDKGVRFLPGVLAEAMAKEQKVFYAAEQHFLYQSGVYVPMSEMEAQHLIQEKMLIRETKMSQIVDAEKQWRLKVQKDIRDLNANPYIVGLIALSFNSGAYQTELIRSGIQGVDKGQWEACETLGIGYKTMMKEIILPQAFKQIVPPLVSEFIMLIKDSSLISNIGALELLYAAQVLGKKYYDYLDPLIIAAVMYLTLTILVSWLSKKVERRLAISD